MFFDDLTQIKTLALKTGFSIFVVDQAVIKPNSNLKTAKTPKDFFPKLQSYVAPTKSDTGKIGIDEVREIIEHCRAKQTSDHYIIIEDATALSQVSQDALLKLLEEPRENYHFVIFTTDLGPILETVRSRANIFVQRHKNLIKNPPAVDNDILVLAKKMLTVSARDVPAFAEELTNPKLFKTPREPVLQITTTAIELAYKSYFITKNPAFLKKLPHLLTLEQNLRGNGNIKLQLVANLI